MQTVWKFELEIEDYQSIEMPKGAKLLTVEVQFGIPVLYALVNPDAEKVERAIRIAGTGHSIVENNIEYIGSFQMHGGAFVAHVFEIQ